MLKAIETLCTVELLDIPVRDATLHGHLKADRRAEDSDVPPERLLFSLRARIPGPNRVI